MKFGSDRTERGFPLEGRVGIEAVRLFKQTANREIKNQEAGNEKQAARSRKWAGCHILPVGGCREVRLNPATAVTGITLTSVPACRDTPCHETNL
jgi:hypothetical protein